MRALLRAWRRELLRLTVGTRPWLSVIIPTLNAAGSLAECLKRVAGAGDLIVADGGSNDVTVRIAKDHGAKVIAAARGRGVQLRAGAEAATGEWLLFVHADTLLDAEWLEVARRHIEARPQHAACFRFELDATAWQARLLERGVALRAGLLGLPYGDQGLLISRALYDKVGGYRALALMEDVDLVRRIGRRRLRLLDAAAVTSAERWRRDGWWRRSARNLSCLALYGLKVSPERIARLYG